MHPPRVSSTSHAIGGACCSLAASVLLWTGCATTGPGASDPSAAAQVQQLLTQIIDAVETKDLARLDSYHWYGPQFTKFGSTGDRLDAEAAREGEHKGISALAGLKLRTDELKIDVFGDAAVATFLMTASFSSNGNAVTKQERGTLVFVKHDGSWVIVHEHFSAAQ